MCAFAIAKIRGGGEVNLQAVGLSSLGRHSAMSVQVDDEVTVSKPLAPVRTYVPPRMDMKNIIQNPVMKQLVTNLTKYFLRGGEEGLVSLNHLVEYRLTGGTAGKVAHTLVDDFMAVQRPLQLAVKRQLPTKRPRNAYENNTKDPGNLQRRRIRNAGDYGKNALSTGRSSKKKKAVRNA